MPLTPDGFTARRLPEIRESIRSALETGLGTPITSDPSTVMGVLLSIFAGETAEQENLNQSAYTQLDIDKAEGVYLDKLVAYIGLRRLAASPASGQLLVWRNGVGSIESAVLFEDGDGERFAAVNGVEHVLSSCNEVLVSPSSATEGLEYSVTINNVIYSYVATSGDTAADIVTDIGNQISSTTTYTVELDGNNLRIAADINDQNDLNVVYSRFQLLEIASFNFVESVDVGQIFVNSNTITNIVTSNPSLLRANNPLPFTDGRDVETDEELRARHEVSTQVASVATVPAIRASLRNLANVISAEIVENRQIVPDSEGRPAKSYECIVEGGDPNQIADTIWETKPAGVETTGDISTIVIDFGGNQQVVSWSRPIPVYLHVRLTYELYDEETFPTNGEVALVDAILAYGATLGLGDDVISTRFYGEIYSSVDGIGNILVETGTSSSPSATEPDSWSTSPVDIADNEFAEFARGRIDVQEQS